MPYMGKSPTAAVAETSAKTAAYTVIASDSGKTILCSAASADYAVALTAAATLGNGFTVTLKKTDATKFMITINPNSTETIDGLLDLKLRNEHSEATLICDGSNWHLISHENVAIEYNAVENANFLVDQYSHITRTGLGASNVVVQDRWQLQAPGSSASARWTYSNESDGGVNGKSKWGKFLCTTADASPDAAEGNNIRQSIIGNNGSEFLGTDGFVEGAVLSLDVILHADGSSSISFPAKVAMGWTTVDGSAKSYIADVLVTAADTWQRVVIPIPENSAGDIDPGVDLSNFVFIGLYGGSNRVGTVNTWNATVSAQITATSENLADSTNNYIGLTNVKLQPGQIATPFIPRMFGEEELLCFKYAYKWTPDEANASIGVGWSSGTTEARCDFQLPTNMRTNNGATLATSGTASDYRINVSASTNACNAVPTLNHFSGRSGQLVFSIGSANLVNDEAANCAAATTDGFLFFEDEI